MQCPVLVEKLQRTLFPPVFWYSDNVSVDKSTVEYEMKKTGFRKG
jgi:hypothetical protein